MTITVVTIQARALLVIVYTNTELMAALKNPRVNTASPTRQLSPGSRSWALIALPQIYETTMKARLPQIIKKADEPLHPLTQSASHSQQVFIEHTDLLIAFHLILGGVSIW